MLIGNPYVIILLNNEISFRSFSQQKKAELWSEDTVFNPTISSSSFDADRSLNFPA